MFPGEHVSGPCGRRRASGGWNLSVRLDSTSLVAHTCQGPPLPCHHCAPDAPASAVTTSRGFCPNRNGGAQGEIVQRERRYRNHGEVDLALRNHREKAW